MSVAEILDVSETASDTSTATSSSETHLEAVPAFDLKKHVEIVPVKTGENRVRIIDNDLRNYLFFNTETNLVQVGHLANDDDSEGHKAMRTSQCVFPISAFVAHLPELRDIKSEDLGDDDVSWEVFAGFVQIIEDHFAKHSAESLQAFKEGMITFNQLGTALAIPGQLVAVTFDESLAAGKTKSAEVKHTFYGTYIELKITMYLHTGKQLIASEVTNRINYFKGQKSSEELGVFYLDNHPGVKAKLVERGEKYLKITDGANYQQYSSTIVRKSYWGSRHFKAAGRVMVDAASMRRVDSNYGYYFGVDRYAENIDSAENKVTEITDEVKLCLPPVVYGFSFVSKTWGEMLVDKITNIDFRSDAYEKLVLNETTKRMVFSLVETDYTGNTDLVSGKGGGCIFLLAGPPGVGKTLTSEAIAERLHRPLYMVSVGELGTNVESLEESLRQILDTAAAWNAVLLIDEADIFLEARTDLNIERNAMVGVFLRLLEYYEGILFLTTNRAENIDQAFFSRISLAIYYKDLGIHERQKIWATLLSNAKIDPSHAELLYIHKLNGRQIKNCIRNANALAQAEGRVVEYRDFMTVINTVVEFDDLMAAKREAAKPKAPVKPGLWTRIKEFLFGGETHTTYK